ncbi:unnamed protein product [Amoebophrya sp. A25]|nr:unnamed protein product [Amoebophrya sp. A25]|eukprot:GSA25T00021835001.1
MKKFRRIKRRKKMVNKKDDKQLASASAYTRGRFRSRKSKKAQARSSSPSLVPSIFRISTSSSSALGSATSYTTREYSTIYFTSSKCSTTNMEEQPPMRTTSSTSSTIQKMRSIPRGDILVAQQQGSESDNSQEHHENLNNQLELVQGDDHDGHDDGRLLANKSIPSCPSGIKRKTPASSSSVVLKRTGGGDADSSSAGGTLVNQEEEGVRASQQRKRPSSSFLGGLNDLLGLNRSSRSPTGGVQNSQLQQVRSFSSSSSRAGGDERGDHDTRTRPPRVIEHLLEKQRRHFPRILDELETHGRKTSHWMWYPFPTDKEGFSEPSPRTYVTEETAHFLLENPETAPMWRNVLELIARLQLDAVPIDPAMAKHLKATGSKRRPQATQKVLPRIDHGRMHFFIEFWKNCKASPPWLLGFCDVMENYDWGH